ncbi:hypothetical protein N752_04510 [Desulforamulus aquiferis]|nr:hypothetical protein N752_04510 [Desulforamulus aquiferis]
MKEKEKSKKEKRRPLPKFLKDGMLRPLDDNSGAT